MFDRKKYENNVRIQQSLPGNRQERRQRAKHAKRMVARDHSIIQNQIDDGPDLIADQELRKFLIEYNHRLMSAGDYAMPANFNGLKDFFVQPTPNEHIFKLKNEENYLFYLSDFLDFITSPEKEIEDFNQLPWIFEENLIYSFNTLDPVGDITITSETGVDYYIFSISCVRVKNKLTVFQTVGKIVNEIIVQNSFLEEEKVSSVEELSEKMYKDYKGEVGEAKRRMILHSNNEKLLEKDVEITNVGGFSKMQNCHTISIIDLSIKEIIARYYLEENEANHRTIIDDYEVFARDPNISAKTAENLLSNAGISLAEKCGLFELSRNVNLLLSYFKFKYTLVKKESVKKDSHKSNNKAKSKISVTKKSSNYKIVSALRIVPQSKPFRKFTKPKYSVEVRGFYRKLSSPNSIGKDMNGNPIQGYTWVKSHERYTNNPSRRNDILIKSQVSIAKIIRDNIDEQSNLNRDEVVDENHSTINNYYENKESNNRSESEQELKKDLLESEDLNIDNNSNENHESLDHKNKEHNRIKQHEELSPPTKLIMYEERKKLTPKLRMAILDRDNYICQICGIDATSENGVKLQVDHIIPISKWGKTVLHNLRTTCSMCNIGRSNNYYR